MKILQALSIAVIFSAATYADTGFQQASPTQDNKRTVLSNKDQENMLFQAAREGNLSMISTLLRLETNVNAVSENGYTPLILAAYNGHTEVVKLLLSHDANSCLADERGDTALMGAVFKDNREIVRLLIQPGMCEVDFKNKKDQTALTLAAHFGRTEIAKALLKAGANPNLIDKSGKSPKTIAASQGNRAITLMFAQEE